MDKSENKREKGLLPMNKSQDWDLDEQLRKAVGSPETTDFEGWRKRHGEALAYLNPVVTELYHRRRRIVMRTASAAVAVVIFLAVAFLLSLPQKESFALAVQAIDKAETVTYTMTTYSREYSEDGKRTWLRKFPRMDMAYKAPDLYRVTSYDREGNVHSVSIVDKLSNKTLNLDIKSKKATFKPEPPNTQLGRGNPIGWIAHTLESDPIEFVGQREAGGVKVNVFRSYRTFSHTSFDIWLDARTKHVVEVCEPGADCFDLATAVDRDNPAEKRFSKGELAVTIISDIVFDAPLDAKLFSLTPPEGFTVVQEPPPQPPPPVTEAEMIEWLGVVARFNNGTFVEGIDFQKHNEAGRKDKADRTAAEQRYLDLDAKQFMNRHKLPIRDFANEYAVPGTFRFIGNGVKLGSSDRLVCWYKLKSTGRYRAVYGDLTVKDVSPEDLPLPVKK
ncbi:MAG: LolA family protein [Thermoguttaceae bacterium]